jgi:hypothetical protein
LNVKFERLFLWEKINMEKIVVYCPVSIHTPSL